MLKTNILHSGSAIGKFTILVVDDEKLLLDLYCMLLRREGYSVVCAMNGNEAIERFIEARPDLVILDYEMPIKDGLETAKEILCGSTGKPRAGVIIMSANGDVKGEAEKIGISLFLEKPLSSEHILSAINSQFATMPDTRNSILQPARIMVK